MRDADKTKEQLVNELGELRQRFVELEAAESNRKQTEERYRHLYEQSPIGIGLASPNGKVISGNKAMETIFGYSIEELKEINIADLYENLEDRKALIEAISRYGAVVNFPVRLKRKNGTPFDCLLTISQFHGLGSKSLFQTICIDITERKRAEEALRESEKRYRQLFEGVGDAVMVYSSQVRFLDCNEVAFQRYGYSREEFLSLGATDIVHPDFHQVMKDNQKRIWAGESTVVESAHRCKDGRVIPVEVSARRIEYQGESAVLGVVRDITERKQAEEALRASEEKYRALVENANEAVVVAQDGMLEFVNPKTIEIMGHSKEELTSRPFVEFIHPDDREMVVERHRRRLEGEEILDVYPFRVITKEGDIKWVEINVVLIEWEGRPATLTLLSDITERKWAEGELRKQTTRNELILQTAMDGFCVLDVKGKILEANHAISVISGYSREALLSMNIRDLEAVETPEETTKHINTVMREGTDRFETRHRRKDGRIVELEVSANFVNMDEESFFFSFFRDITERKRGEQTLLQREKELEIKTSNLEEVNTALRVLLKKREEDKTELEENVLFNVKELVVFYIEKLKGSGLNERQRAWVDILESNLNDIISPFSRRLSSIHLNLTPTEMEVANLVKNGKTTKEIAEFLNVSSHAIEFHRRNIRRRLGIQNKKANLRTYLLSMQ
ncbi:MAG: PAS domain S-box protein [Candidatus Hodarchaeota archaeon]